MGALIAGETNKAALASPARVNLNRKLFNIMLFSFPPWFCFSPGFCCFVSLAVCAAQCPLVLQTIRWFKGTLTAANARMAAQRSQFAPAEARIRRAQASLAQT